MPKDAHIMEVPFLDLAAQYRSIKPEINEALDRVLESQSFIMGEEVRAFEKEAAEYCQAGYAVACASGSDALLLSLMALDIGPGDYVITTPYTFFATAGAISRVGATPVFLDIDPGTYNLDPGQVRRFLTGEHPLNSRLNMDGDDVRAMIPVHLYGQMADMDPLMELAGQFDIRVIEDAAQGIGSEYKGRRAGSVGDLGCFSFFPSKNLGAYGDGGMVATGSEELAQKTGILRVHGAEPKYHHSVVGINSRLDALQAAVLKVKLRYLDRWSEARREKALRYNRLFEEAGLAMRPGQAASSLDGADDSFQDLQKGIICPVETAGSPDTGGRHIYHQYVIRTGARDRIAEAFDEKQIGYSIYYPVPLHEQECFQYLGYQPADCPVSIRAAKTTLALPIYPELSDGQQEYVVEVIEKVLEG